MHRPRRNGAPELAKLADRLADWLLAHCPLSTVTLLTLLVGAPLGIPRPWRIVVLIAMIDAALNAIRWRRTKRGGPAPSMRSRATA
jgi:hypothetical protein